MPLISPCFASGYSFCLYVLNDRPSGIPEEAKWAKVDRVVDGDTIVLMDRTRVHLHGIDAPERDQPYGPMATAALEYMIEKSIMPLRQTLTAWSHGGHPLSPKDGYDINASLVCAGYAWWYERYAPNDELLENCQKEAREASKGLWMRIATAPWEWRRRAAPLTSHSKFTLF